MFLLRLVSRYRVFLVYGIGALIFVGLHSALSQEQWQTYAPALLITGFVAILAVNSIHIRKR